MKITKICLGILTVAIWVFMVLALRQIIAISTSAQEIRYDLVPFNHQLPEAHLSILFLGDSTAVGVGAENNRLTTAGYFAMDFPHAEIINISHNGQRIRELLNNFDAQVKGRFDLVVIQIGGNDIIWLTSFADIERDLALLIEKAKAVGRHVVILHSGNVGAAPIFQWPFDLIMTDRSRRVRGIYMHQAKTRGVFYVDLFSERERDFFLKDVNRYYSKDLLHPSGEGYRWWYHRIHQSLNESGVGLISSL